MVEVFLPTAQLAYGLLPWLGIIGGATVGCLMVRAMTYSDARLLSGVVLSIFSMYFALFVPRATLLTVVLLSVMLLLVFFLIHDIFKRGF